VSKQKLLRAVEKAMFEGVEEILLEELPNETQSKRRDLAKGLIGCIGEFTVLAMKVKAGLFSSIEEIDEFLYERLETLREGGDSNER